MNLPGRDSVDRWLIFLAAIVMAMWGGEPYFHPDIIVDEAIVALNEHGNPHYFHYPGLVIYLHAGCYAALGLLTALASPGHQDWLEEILRLN